jgi:hypothetical protein
MVTSIAFIPAPDDARTTPPVAIRNSLRSFFSPQAEELVLLGHRAVRAVDDELGAGVEAEGAQGLEHGGVDVATRSQQQLLCDAAPAPRDDLDLQGHELLPQVDVDADLVGPWIQAARLGGSVPWPAATAAWMTRSLTPAFFRAMIPDAEVSNAGGVDSISFRIVPSSTATCVMRIRSSFVSASFCCCAPDATVVEHVKARSAKRRRSRRRPRDRRCRAAGGLSSRPQGRRESAIMTNSGQEERTA